MFLWCNNGIENVCKHKDSARANVRFEHNFLNASYRTCKNLMLIVPLLSDALSLISVKLCLCKHDKILGYNVKFIISQAKQFRYLWKKIALTLTFWPSLCLQKACWSKEQYQCPIKSHFQAFLRSTNKAKDLCHNTAQMNWYKLY